MVDFSCSDIPDSLFDHDAAIEHFGKFGPIVKIVLQPKKKSCIVAYETRDDADKAILNAGAYDGFMFDVKLIKKRYKISYQFECYINFTIIFSVLFVH